MRKIMIGLLAFALIACGVVAVTAVADEETDAANTKVEYSKVFKGTGEEKLDISTNEAAFKLAAIYGTVEVKWTYKDAAAAWQDLALGTEFTIGDWKYKLVNKGDGLYELSMKTDQNNVTTVLDMKYTLTIKPEDGSPTDLIMEVVVNISKQGSVIPASLKDNSYQFFVDTAIKRDDDGKIHPLDATDAELKTEDYKWSAKTLPEGMSITADGYLSGIPKKVTTGTAIPSYEIYAEDSFGNIGKYEVYIGINPRADDVVRYYVHKGTTGSFDSTTAYPDPKVSAVQKGDEVYLVTSDAIAGTNNVKVKVVDGTSTGYQKELTFTVDNGFRFYALPTDLTGAYGIIIETTNNVYNSTLYVLPQLDVVVAGIGVSSSSNANNNRGGT